MVRVTVEGALEDWPEPGLAAHMKIFLPQGDDAPVMRTYTVRRFDRALREVDIDVVLHAGGGPAARWAESAVPGDMLELSGLARSTFAIDDGEGKVSFVGEESSLPAIATCVEALPEGSRATVLVEVAGSEEEQPLDSAATLDVRWLHRGGRAHGEVLERAVAALTPELVQRRVWVACEAGVMRRLRRHLLDGGVARERLATRGYWKLGDAGHPDHDTGDDDDG
jgi:NADPH-dependent ferric siderophore reductase